MLHVWGEWDVWVVPKMHWYCCIDPEWPEWHWCWVALNWLIGTGALWRKILKTKTGQVDDDFDGVPHHQGGDHVRGDNCAASLEHRMSRVSPSLRLAHTHRYNIIVYRLYYRILCTKYDIVWTLILLCASCSDISEFSEGSDGHHFLCWWLMALKNFTNCRLSVKVSSPMVTYHACIELCWIWV